MPAHANDNKESTKNNNDKKDKEEEASKSEEIKNEKEQGTRLKLFKMIQLTMRLAAKCQKEELEWMHRKDHQKMFGFESMSSF